MTDIQTDMIARLRDKEIEVLMTRLESLIVKHGLEKVDHAGLRFKSAGQKLAAKDLPVAACWYMRCVSGGKRQTIMASKPDSVILGVIRFFEDLGWK